jgi:hypothetical protein
MIKSELRHFNGSHFVEIGNGKEYGYVQVTVANNAFTVAVFDQFDRPVKHDIYPIKRNLTTEEIAFMDAYQRSVSDAHPNIVEDYLRMEGDDFYDKYGGEYYTGLTDAHGVWRDALEYAKDPAYFTK